MGSNPLKNERLFLVWYLQNQAYPDCIRYDWCAPLSHPSACMLVNLWPSQQSSKEEYKPWKWSAIARYYTYHTDTMLPTRKSMPRSRRQLDYTKTSLPLWRDAKCSGMIVSPVHQVWPKTILQGTVKRGKKTRQTEEEVGRQHQWMDRPGVRQVPEGSGEQGKMEKTGCKIICGAPATLAVKG